MRVLREWHDEEAKEYSSSDQLSTIWSSTDSDCTRTHLRGPGIQLVS